MSTALRDRDQLAHWRQRLERIKVRFDVEDCDWLVRRCDELLTEIECQAADWPVQARLID